MGSYGPPSEPIQREVIVDLVVAFSARAAALIGLFRARPHRDPVCQGLGVWRAEFALQLLVLTLSFLRKPLLDRAQPIAPPDCDVVRLVRVNRLRDAAFLDGSIDPFSVRAPVDR